MKSTMPSLLKTPGRARSQAGFTIIEMMVALAISMFVILAFSATFVNMKVTFNNQTGLSQLQDNERLAMTILTASLGEAGYFPVGADINAVPKVPPKSLDRSAIVASTDTQGGAMVVAQYLFGTTAGAGTVETLSTAYVAGPSDGLLTCQGGTNPSASAALSLRNTFYVDTATNTLGCTVMAAGSYSTAPGSTFQPLISGVQSMSVLYGVASGGSVIDRYRQAKDMATADWSNVKNVQITLNFINPNAPTAAPITWTQNINVMNNKTL